MSDYVSEVKLVAAPQERVYAKLSDLNNLGALREAIKANPERLAQIEAETSKHGAGGVLDKLDAISFTADSVSIPMQGLGNITLQVIEREEPKLIKFEAVGSPIPVNVWVQIVPADEANAKLRVTLRAELNFFIKQMVGGQLQKAVDGIANGLASIPY